MKTFEDQVENMMMEINLGSPNLTNINNEMNQKIQETHKIIETHP